MRKSKKPGFLLNLLVTTKYFVKTRFLSPCVNPRNRVFYWIYRWQPRIW